MPALDEVSANEAAANLTLAEANSTRADLNARKNSAGAQEEGRQYDLDQLEGRHQRRVQLRATKAAEGAKEKAAHVLAFIKASSKSPIETAAASWGRIADEDNFLQAVLTRSQEEISAGRERLRLAHIETLKANLAFLESDVILMCVQHREATKPLRELNPTIEDIPSPKISEALDLISRLTVELNQKQKEKVN